MKTGKQRIVSCICFCLLLAFCFIKTADLLEAKAARVKYTDFFQDETNIDVILMGTSHMYNTGQPQELWKNYGITSYNWGYSNSTPAENYYLLKDIVRYTDVKLVVVDVYGIVEYEGFNNKKYRTDRIEQQHVQYDELPFSWNKLQGVKDVFDDYEYNEDFIFNFLLYHTRWDELSQGDFKVEKSQEKGACMQLGYAEGTVDYISPDERVEIDSVCSEYMKRIIEFCNENNIELLFVYLPFGGAGETAQRVSNSFQEFAEPFGDFQYLNLIYTDAVNYSTDLYVDKSHLNWLGGCKVTKLLGEYIRQNYRLEDHREDAEYSSWWKGYEEYQQYKYDILPNQETVYDVLQLVWPEEYYIEAYEDGETLIAQDTFLSNYFQDKKESTVYHDLQESGDNAPDYEMILHIYDTVADAEIARIGVKGEDMTYDILE